MGAGLSNTTPFVSSTLKIVPTALVMTGAATFQITIDREAKVDAPAGKGPKRASPLPPPGKAEDAKPKAGAKNESQNGASSASQPSK